MLPVDVLLLRGLAREKGHWGSFLDNLEKQEFVKEVQAIDLMGMGEYRKLTSPLTIGENAEFVLSQIDHSRFNKGIIVSVSLGSMVAVEMGHRRPDLFKKIFLMNTSFANLSPIYHRLQLEAFRQFYKILTSKDEKNRELEVLKMVSQKTELHDELSKEWAGIAQKHPISGKNVLRQLAAAATYRLKKVPPSVPLVVFNSLGDQMVNPKCSEKLSTTWGIPIKTHPSAGHDICVDDPQWVLEQIKNSLNEL